MCWKSRNFQKMPLLLSWKHLSLLPQFYQEGDSLDIEGGLETRMSKYLWGLSSYQHDQHATNLDEKEPKRCTYQIPRSIIWSFHSHCLYIPFNSHNRRTSPVKFPLLIVLLFPWRCPLVWFGTQLPAAAGNIDLLTQAPSLPQILFIDIKLYYISYVSNIKTKKASGSRNWFNFGPQFRSIHFFWLQETSGSWGSHCRPQRPQEENETSPAVNQNIFGHDYLSCIGIGVCIHSTMCLYSKISQRGMWSYVYRILKLYSSSHTLN